VEAVKFLWKRNHFEERSWKRKQNIFCFHFPALVPCADYFNPDTNKEYYCILYCN